MDLKSCSIKVVSYNCRGLLSSMRDVQMLCKQYHIIVLQETWVAKQNLSFLSTVSETHHAFGISSVDYETGLFVGRPYGGTAILWDRSLPASPWFNDDNSIIGLKLKVNKTTIGIVNVYLPYCSSANVDDYLMYLSKVNSMCESVGDCNLCVVGDFNASDTNMFGKLLNSFCAEYSYLISDKLLLPADTFTYVSDCHGSTTWIDHCLSSASFHQAIQNMTVLQDIIISDHRPLAFDISCANLPIIEIKSDIKLSNKVIWGQVTSDQKYAYSLMCKKLFSEINLPTSVINCEDPLCQSDQHLSSIESFYSNLISAIQRASDMTLISSRALRRKKITAVPGWNKHVKKAHSAARIAYQNWIRHGRMKTGYWFELMNSKRKLFKKALRCCKNSQERHEAEALAAALISDKSGKLFWRKINKFKKSSIPASVGGAEGVELVSEMWKNHYCSLLNSVKSNDTVAKDFVQSQMHCSVLFNNFNNFCCTPDVLGPLMCKLKLNCAAGADNITAEHLCYSDHSIKFYLSVLFNMCLRHGFVPKACLDTLLVPIVKNKNKIVQDTNNYRPIALATVISKLLERYILHRILPSLHTSQNQFGFKPKHSTDMSVFLLKQTISSYVDRNTPVFAVFLDASKAFDKVNHDVLFQKLIVRGVPLYFVRLLLYWYQTQCMQISWCGVKSSGFTISNGVRQGGVLSPYLFSVYVDQLSESLNAVRSGCYVGKRCINHIFFADDITLFSPSLTGLQELVDVCYDYALSHDIVFNCNKSRGMLFTPNHFNLSCKSPVLTLGKQRIYFVDSVKYLGVHLSNSLLDDDDILRLVRSVYGTGNKLKYRFSKCSTRVKNTLYRCYCMNLYGCQLWCKFRSGTLNRLRIAYNDSYRILHNIPRYISARLEQINANLTTFEALLRKCLFSFVTRCMQSKNILMTSLMSSDVFYQSEFFRHYKATLN